jgi:phosphomannomutase
MHETETRQREKENPLPGGKDLLRRLRTLILNSPKASFTAEQVAKELGLELRLAERCLEYLAAPEREYEVLQEFHGVAKVVLQGAWYYEALSDNPDVRRDYDFRATNEGGRDFCPKNMFYYVWAWINLAEENCQKHGLANNRTVLITHDCRYYPPEIIEAAKEAARLRGYKVVFAFAQGRDPSCVSSYSHAVRIVRPVLAIFITASHVSRPAANTVIGAKVSRLGPTGQLESLSTKDIKVSTARELKALKENPALHELIHSEALSDELEVAESHTRLAIVGALASLRLIPGKTLYDVAQDLKKSADIDASLKNLLPAGFSPPFAGLRIVVEGAHTSSGPLAERALRILGAQTTLLHGEVQAVRGPHAADPSITRNLKDLFAEMTKQKAHLGIAFDLDGDRGAVVLPNPQGEFDVLAPDRIGQVLIPFLMQQGGYSQTPKPLHVRDCLSTDAVLDQGKVSGVTVETTDAGYVFLKKRERDKAKDGFLGMSMGEASGHAWLDYTGPFENPIVMASLFAAMCAQRIQGSGGLAAGEKSSLAVHQVFTELAIPYRKSTRFQPLFSPALVAEVARDPANDTGWSPGQNSPVPQKLISLCRSTSIRKIRELFAVGKKFQTALGELKVELFDAQWDEEENIFRFGKIYFSLGGGPVGSFVSRGSSNDPTAVQVWEVKEFEGEKWNGVRLPEETIQQRFDLIGGLVLSTCEQEQILELTDRPPAANMTEVLQSLERYRKTLRPG